MHPLLDGWRALNAAMPAPASFVLGGVAAWALVVVLAARFRNRFYATFLAILLGTQTALAAALYPQVRADAAAPLFVYLQAATFLHFLRLVWPAMRSLPYRLLVSLPGHVFVGGTILALPWALPGVFGLALPGWWAPYALALFGALQSLRPRRETRDIVLDGRDAGPLARHPLAAPPAGAGPRPLRLAQITDPHLGPWMSPRRLRRLCERVVAADPDLVLLTGDFLTMESQATPRHLEDALAPLRQLRGRCFACMGNHDHEAPEVVKTALGVCGVTLLVDDAQTVDTPVGPVQIVGSDFHFRDRKARLARRHPREEGALRLWLLHDPGAFRHVPEGEADLVLAGHTHGGQVGLVSLGLDWTVVWAAVKMPDHGLFARGPDRLYVHRGTGHYGFPVRLGVPAEESVLRVWR
ncbi:MAG TPA: metallophosphoesterase [Polyangiaceae bacterium LLY-WYZ-15_(1-7)]|nr:metallophosphoesterase [Polyangiaceae bacterium LLY-WYZ-15_(1-7)]